MKIITFINYAYIDLVHNLYLQLKQFNLHKDFIIYCTDYDTANTLTNQIVDRECEVLQYSPLLLKEVLTNYQQHLCNKQLSSTTTADSDSYAIYQFLKHDAFYQTLLKHDQICFIDADMIIRHNFVTTLQQYIQNNTSPTTFGFKYYLNIRQSINTEYPHKLYQWIGKEQLINTGFIYAKQSDKSLQHVQNYCQLFIPHFGARNNLDEMILTVYFRNVIENIVPIPDHVNLISNSGIVYTPQQVLELNPLTFHPTFTADKISYIKQCNHWFLNT